MHNFKKSKISYNNLCCDKKLTYHFSTIINVYLLGKIHIFLDKLFLHFNSDRSDHSTTSTRELRVLTSEDGTYKPRHHIILFHSKRSVRVWWTCLNANRGVPFPLRPQSIATKIEHHDQDDNLRSRLKGRRASSSSL